MYRKHVEIPSLARTIISYGKDQAIDRIWIILEGQTMIWLAERLIKKNIFPVHAQVWDTPHWWVKANLLDNLSAKIICKSYDFVVKNSTQFGSASFNMASIYKDRYGKESFPLIGITPNFSFEDEPKVQNQKKIIIGLAGQIYSIDTFSKLIKALDSIYWNIDGREVELHYWGYSPLPERRTRIILRGYVPQEKLCSELKQCDVLYCPYWFDNNFAEVAKTSFPSKITSYFQSGVIVLFHGPSYSSPGMMLFNSNAAVCCFSNDLEVIKLNLRESIYCKDKQERIKSANHLLNNQLNESYLHNNFKNFMNFEGVK
ncbi:MAG: hypothetical protein ACXWRE_02415 [Pseudobdellovibrionaceae bacterium]